jgi:hypothetical protein
MKLAAKIAIGLLLGCGIPITLMATTELLDSTNPPQDREEAKAALVIFGLAPVSLGGLLLWNARRHNQQQQTNRLQSRFFDLLKKNRGQITSLQFAMATGLNGKLAKAYLDEQAKEFDAVYNVTADGTIVYYFEYFELEHRDGSFEFRGLD